MAHGCLKPVVNAATPEDSPVRGCAVARLSVVVPLPSSPSELKPQHLTHPAGVTAQEWLTPKTRLEWPRLPCLAHVRAEIKLAAYTLLFIPG